MTATDTFSNSDVTLQACVVGYCPEIASKNGGKLCDEWLTATEGQECGEPGAYSISHTEEIPSDEQITESMWWFVKSTVTVNMIVGDEEECDAQADNAYNMSYSMVGMASVVLCAAAYASNKKRRSRSGNNDEEDENGSQFVEMGDVAIV